MQAQAGRGAQMSPGRACRRAVFGLIALHLSEGSTCAPSCVKPRRCTRGPHGILMRYTAPRLQGGGLDDIARYTWKLHRFHHDITALEFSTPIRCAVSLGEDVVYRSDVARRYIAFKLHMGPVCRAPPVCVNGLAQNGEDVTLAVHYDWGSRPPARRQVLPDDVPDMWQVHDAVVDGSRVWAPRFSDG